MHPRKRKTGDALNLTPEEAESMGVEAEYPPAPEGPDPLEDLPMHEQIAGELTEEDVAEALLGEVTAESLETVEEAVGDRQEEEAEEVAEDER